MKKHNLSLLLRSSHLLHSTHLKFGIIAAALSVLTMFIGLSDYSPMFRTATGSEFGLSVTGNLYIKPDPEDEEYDPLITTVYPGQVLTLNPTVKNSGSLPMYVFVKVNYDELAIDTTEKGEGDDKITVEDISSNWKPLNGWSKSSSYDPTGDRIFYYGNDGGVIPFDPNTTSLLFDTLTVPTTANVESSFTPTVTAYGIQTEGISGNPEEIWQLIETSGGQ